MKAVATLSLLQLTGLFGAAIAAPTPDQQTEDTTAPFPQPPTPPFFGGGGHGVPGGEAPSPGLPFPPGSGAGSGPTLPGGGFPPSGPGPAQPHQPSGGEFPGPFPPSGGGFPQSGPGPAPPHQPSGGGFPSQGPGPVQPPHNGPGQGGGPSGPLPGFPSFPFPNDHPVAQRDTVADMGLESMSGVDNLAGLEGIVKSVCDIVDKIQATLATITKASAQPKIIQAIPAVTSQLGDLNKSLGGLGGVTGSIGGLTGGAQQTGSLGLKGSSTQLTLVSTLLNALANVISCITANSGLGQVGSTTLQPITSALGSILGTVGNALPLNTISTALDGLGGTVKSLGSTVTGTLGTLGNGKTPSLPAVGSGINLS